MFEFCPNCAEKKIVFYDNKKWKCRNCSFEYYHNVAGAVAVLLIKDNKILFTVRNNEPQLGKLDLPGGFIDPKESAEECCVRELCEELKINIKKENLKYLGSAPNIYLYKNIIYNTIDLFFLYPFEEEIKQFDADELKDIQWISLHEILYEKLAFGSQKKILEALLHQKTN